MAVQPIDLQAVYTQMDKAAQIASRQQNGLQLANALQESQVVRETAEQASQVQKAAQNEAEIKMRDNDQKSSQGDIPNGKKKRRNSDSQEKNDTPQTEIRELYLGQHIDITG